MMKIMKLILVGWRQRKGRSSLLGFSEAQVSMYGHPQILRGV
ncbi:MAG: hypothetical protein ABGX31_02675 [bacterium]